MKRRLLIADRCLAALVLYTRAKVKGHIGYQDTAAGVGQALPPNATYFGSCGVDPLVRGRRPRRPSPAATTLILLGQKRVQGDPRGPGGPPLDRPIVSPARDLVHFGLQNGVPAKDWARQGGFNRPIAKVLVHFAFSGLAG